MYVLAGASSEEAKVAQHPGPLLPGADPRDHPGPRPRIQRARPLPRLSIRPMHHRVHNLSKHLRLQAHHKGTPSRRARQDGPRPTLDALHRPSRPPPPHGLRPGRLRPRRSISSQSRNTAPVPPGLPDPDREHHLPPRRRVPPRPRPGAHLLQRQAPLHPRRLGEGGHEQGPGVRRDARRPDGAILSGAVDHVRENPGGLEPDHLDAQLVLLPHPCLLAPRVPEALRDGVFGHREPGQGCSGLFTELTCWRIRSVRFVDCGFEIRSVRFVDCGFEIRSKNFVDGFDRSLWIRGLEQVHGDLNFALILNGSICIG
ncbi:hypothetical protein M758_4G109200 [Ceratodon purpureus]|nr:hypothetical protein M758_4G109200 [Ceratodon purpureus]